MSSSSGSSSSASDAQTQTATDLHAQKEVDRVSKNVNLAASGNRDKGYELSQSVSPEVRERMEALQLMFDSRVKEIQQSRLQPGRQTTMITGRQ